jgi:hypothetical protein
MPPIICMTWARMAGSMPGASSIPGGIDSIIRARMADSISAGIAAPPMPGMPAPGIPGIPPPSRLGMLAPRAPETRP